MAKKQLNERQLEFCKQVAIGKTAAQAYEIAFPDASAATCAVNASKLLKQPLIAEEIKRQQEINRQIVSEANKDKIATIPQFEIIDRARRMQILSAIAEGKLKITRIYGSEMGPVPVEVEPDYTDRKSAIAELNKMDGQYAAEQHEHKVNTITVNYVGKRKP